MILTHLYTSNKKYRELEVGLGYLGNDNYSWKDVAMRYCGDNILEDGISINIENRIGVCIISKQHSVEDLMKLLDVFEAEEARAVIFVLDLKDYEYEQLRDYPKLCLKGKINHKHLKYTGMTYLLMAKNKQFIDVLANGKVKCSIDCGGDMRYMRYQTVQQYVKNNREITYDHRMFGFE